MSAKKKTRGSLQTHMASKTRIFVLVASLPSLPLFPRPSSDYILFPLCKTGFAIAPFNWKFVLFPVMVEQHETNPSYRKPIGKGPRKARETNRFLLRVVGEKRAKYGGGKMRRRWMGGVVGDD